MDDSVLSADRLPRSTFGREQVNQDARDTTQVLMAKPITLFTLNSTSGLLLHLGLELTNNIRYEKFIRRDD
jgi:hypothetical protein